MMQKTKTNEGETIVNRYSPEQLKEFEEIIDARMSEAEGLISSYTVEIQAFVEDEGNKIKSLEDGSPSVEIDRLTSNIRRQQLLLQQLVNAKLRIKNGVYGVCCETGKLIPEARLRLVPWTTKSMEGKATADQAVNARIRR